MLLTTAIYAQNQAISNEEAWLGISKDTKTNTNEIVSDIVLSGEDFLSNQTISNEASKSNEISLPNYDNDGLVSLNANKEIIRKGITFDFGSGISGGEIGASPILYAGVVYQFNNVFSFGFTAGITGGDIIDNILPVAPYGVFKFAFGNKTDWFAFSLNLMSAGLAQSPMLGFYFEGFYISGGPLILVYPEARVESFIIEAGYSLYLGENRKEKSHRYARMKKRRVPLRK